MIEAADVAAKGAKKAASMVVRGSEDAAATRAPKRAFSMGHTGSGMPLQQHWSKTPVEYVDPADARPSGTYQSLTTHNQPKAHTYEALGPKASKKYRTLPPIPKANEYSSEPVKGKFHGSDAITHYNTPETLHPYYSSKKSLPSSESIENAYPGTGGTKKKGSFMSSMKKGAGKAKGPLKTAAIAGGAATMAKRSKGNTNTNTNNINLTPASASTGTTYNATSTGSVQTS